MINSLKVLLPLSVILWSPWVMKFMMVGAIFIYSVFKWFEAFGSEM